MNNIDVELVSQTRDQNERLDEELISRTRDWDEKVRRRVNISDKRSGQLERLDEELVSWTRDRSGKARCIVSVSDNRSELEGLRKSYMQCLRQGMEVKRLHEELASVAIVHLYI